LVREKRTTQRKGRGYQRHVEVDLRKKNRGLDLDKRERWQKLRKEKKNTNRGEGRKGKVEDRAKFMG